MAGIFSVTDSAISESARETISSDREMLTAVPMLSPMWLSKSTGEKVEARSGVLVAGSQVVGHGYSETQKTIGECQIVSEENAQTIHAHDSGRRRVWMRPRTY